MFVRRLPLPILRRKFLDRKVERVFIKSTNTSDIVRPCALPDYGTCFCGLRVGYLYKSGGNVRIVEGKSKYVLPLKLQLLCCGRLGSGHRVT